MAAPSNKCAVVLVGPKGAGKSTIGSLLAEELDVHFLRVEPLFLEVRARFGSEDPAFEQRGFELVLSSLKNAFSSYDTVCFESTGASRHFSWLLSQLGQFARVLLVRVGAAPEQCAQRVRSRDSSIHIPVSDDRVDQINALARQVSLPWTVEIENGGSFNAKDILRAISSFLPGGENPAAQPGSPPDAAR